METLLPLEGVHHGGHVHCHSDCHETHWKEVAQVSHHMLCHTDDDAWVCGSLCHAIYAFLKKAK